jgi:hypothetical protein
MFQIRTAFTVAANALFMIGAAPALFAAHPTPTANSYSLPMVFEQNLGQSASPVRFLSRGSSRTLFLTPEEAVLRLKNDVIRTRWVGGKTAVLSGDDRLTGSSNYLSKEQQIRGVEQFGKVRFSGIYSGVDLVYYGNQGKLEYDVIVAPNTDPKRIVFELSGASRLFVNHAGQLVLKFKNGEIVQDRPFAYQLVDGQRKQVVASYRLSSGNRVSFELGKYDRNRELVIDPVIQYGRYLGGTSTDRGETIAVDATGAVYVAGQTQSADFPILSALQGASGGSTDAFITKINSAGTVVVYSTYLGGTGNEVAHSITVDSAGNAYIAGETNSANFPTINAVDANFAGSVDGFASKLNPNGNALIYSTYLGGTGNDVAQSVAIDSTGAAYYAGFTSSIDLSGTAGGYNGGAIDASVTKLSPAGALLYSTYLGGNTIDTANGIAVDAAGNAYVTGFTTSTNFTGLPFQPSLAGAEDAFVSKLNASGVREFWAYIGGTGSDIAKAIDLDASGNIYITGDTTSTNFPVLNALQPALGGTVDVFVTKIAAGAAQLLFSTYLGGSGEDRATGLAVGSDGAPRIAGFTASANFPGINTIKASVTGAYDAFVAHLLSTGNGSFFTSLLGGSNADIGVDIAIDAAGDTYIAGQTFSTDLPVPAGGGTLRGTSDAFVMKLGGCSISVLPLAGGFTSAGGTRSLSIQGGVGCAYTAVSDSSFITISGASSGAGNGYVTYNVSANPGLARSGSITVAGQTIPLTQTGSVVGGCTYVGSAPSGTAPVTGNTGSSSISTAGNCAWEAYSNASWLQPYPISGTGTTTITYTAFPNFSTAARTGVITAGGQTYTVSQPGNSLSANERFVQLLYHSFFGRLPSPAEVQFQITQGLNQGATRGQLVRNFFGSEEFNVGGRFVAGLYVGLLDRDAEYGGWLFQRNALSTGIVTRASLVTNFLSGQERIGKFGNPDNANFVNLLYRYVLLREATVAEVDFQAGVLNSGSSTREIMAAGFLDSAEFRGGTGPRLTAFLLYATLLQRDLSVQEFNQRVQEISGGTDILTIINQIVSSTEFNNFVG